MKKKVSTKNKIKEPKYLKATSIIEAEMWERASIERIEAPLRVYFKKVADIVSIYYRPTHNYIKSCKWDDEGKKEISDILCMDKYRFYDIMLEKRIRLLDQNTQMIKNDIVFEDSEAWFIGAWYSQTLKLLAELNIDVERLYEQIPFNYVNQMIGKLNRNGE